MSSNPLSPIRGTLELLILKTLKETTQMHGFSILDWIRETTEEELMIEEGALYHALHRMERRGWIESVWGVSEKSRRAKYYSLTPSGGRALEREEERWDRYVKAVARLSGTRA